MSNLHFRIAYYSFHFICTSATIGFICFCLYKYSQNGDVSQVTFQEFHAQEENLYPSLTICVSSIFYEEKLKSYGEGINVSTYTGFMNGEYWDDRMINVDYDNVTTNFSNFFLGVGMWTPDWRYLKGEEYFLYDHRKVVKENIRNPNVSTVEMNEWTPDFYNSYRDSSQKCFTVDIPFMMQKKVWTFGIVFDSYIFPERIRPYYYEFGVKVHYPGQFLDSKMQKYVWKQKNSDSPEYVTMRFKIQKLEVMKHRKTKTSQCNTNLRGNDERKMLGKIKEVGCKPPWWKEIDDFPVCKSKEKIKTFTKFNVSNYVPACQSVEKILYAYQEFDIVEDWTQEWLDEVHKAFEVMLEFQDATYMEIRQVRDYSIQDVVGDIGGYLGLFLGFAILQIPEFLFRIYFWIEEVIAKKKTNIISISEKCNQHETNETMARCCIEAMNRKLEQNIADINTIKKTLDDIRIQVC